MYILRHSPDFNDKYFEREEYESINPKQYQLDCLEYNPEYVLWGNNEGYMDNNNTDCWDSPCEIENVNELFKLDDYNELVNFYYFIDRESTQCDLCNGSGFSKEATLFMNNYKYNTNGVGPFSGITSTSSQAAREAGIPMYCNSCNGLGYNIVEGSEPRLNLQMWMLHPRKGASRGMILKDIKEDEVPMTIEYLKGARDRNNNKYSKLP